MIVLIKHNHYPCSNSLSYFLKLHALWLTLVIAYFNKYPERRLLQRAHGSSLYPHAREVYPQIVFLIALAGKSISRMTIEADVLDDYLELAQKEFPDHAVWGNRRLCDQIKQVYSGLRAFELKIPIYVDEDFPGSEEDAPCPIQACLEFNSKLTELCTVMNSCFKPLSFSDYFCVALWS